MTFELLSRSDLPDGFEYPPEFLRVVELGLVQLEPWFVLRGDLLRRRLDGLKERYPDRVYVPFADRQDNDDVACFTGSGAEVVIVHDFASPGWERRGREPFHGFHDWLRQAVEDFIEWGEDDLGL
jgi:hypothetical protein